MARSIHAMVFMAGFMQWYGWSDSRPESLGTGSLVAVVRLWMGVY